MSKRTTTRITIPHTHQPDCPIAGVLETLDHSGTPESSGHAVTKKIVLILHGAMGHKDYLFQKQLAQQLPMDTFRFDFRGSHETPGLWRMGGLADDVVDLEVVIAYLTRRLGYEIDMLVGHSRGSLVALRWLCIAPEAKSVRAFVNVSGRYRMQNILAKKQPFNEEGWHEVRSVVARKPFVARVYEEDYQNFAHWNSSLVDMKFPQWVHVLHVHGMADQVVPVYDALIYAKKLSGRSPGTFAMHLSEKADHNFTGLKDEVVEVILGWLGSLETGSLKDGIWLPGVRIDSGSKL